MKSRAAASTRVGLQLEKRAARAESLAPSSETAQEPLRFAAGLYRSQAALAAELELGIAARPLRGILIEDAQHFIEPARAVLGFAAKGPPALAEDARARAQEDRALAISRLEVFWNGDRSSDEDYLSRAILRPYVEVLASLKITPHRAHRRGHCPFCGGVPWIGSRRSGSDMDGAQRFLGCALCGGDWPVNRIECPSCGEGNPEKLPTFQSDLHPSVRIEACETCHRYVKSIDLTVDGRLVPEVDDLLSLSMDVWAVEQGFTRIEPGLAGV